jgi:hypothetical protein
MRPRIALGTDACRDEERHDRGWLCMNVGRMHLHTTSPLTAFTSSLRRRCIGNPSFIQMKTGPVEKSWLARLNYVHQNAVKHGLVPIAHQYPWCSAPWFETNARRRIREISVLVQDRSHQCARRFLAAGGDQGLASQKRCEDASHSQSTSVQNVFNAVSFREALECVGVLASLSFPFSPELRKSSLAPRSRGLPAAAAPRTRTNPLLDRAPLR